MTPLREPITVTIDCVERAVFLRAMCFPTVEELDKMLDHYPLHLRASSELKEIMRSYTYKGQTISRQLHSALMARGIDWKTWLPEKPINVGGNPVEFKDGGIQVGCTFVPKETVLEIAKRIQEAQCS